MGAELWSGAWWYGLLRFPRMFVQMFAGVALFTCGLPRRKRFPLRLSGGLAAGLGVMLLAGRFLADSPGRDYICGLVMAVLSAGIVCLCWRAPASTVSLAMCNGILAYGIATAAKIILSTVFPALDASLLPPAQMLLVDLLYCGATYGALFLALRGRFRLVDTLDDWHKTVLSLLSVFANQSIMSLRIGTAGVQDPSIMHYVYLAGVSVLILVIQFSFARQLQLARDVDTMKELTRQQHLQFQASKENAQLLNEKYHDLKQMIGALRGRPGLDLAALEESVAGYAAPVCTGNEILDVLLTEKRMVCQREGIAITCMAGGAALDFVDELDLYALLSNALTNAIEAASALPPGSGRFINLNASRRGNMAVIHVENPCAGEVEFEDGLPVSRRDRRYHGFGMRSMERTAEKYGGSVAAGLRDGRFFLDILLFDPGEADRIR